MMNGSSPFSSNGGGGGNSGGGGGARKRARSSSSSTSYNHRASTPINNHNNNNMIHHDSSNRLLHLNVGGHPYDIIRTSLPLLQTMMTDRWLNSCLLDSNGRIFLDRDGETFGDILRYLRGGYDFLLELCHGCVHHGGSGGYLGGDRSGGSNNNGHHMMGGGASQSLNNHHHQSLLSSYANNSASMPAGLYSSMNYHHQYHGTIHSTSNINHSTSNINGNAATSTSNNAIDRLRRLRTEADYYGLHQLVSDIDSITIGSKIVFDVNCWGRVAGGFSAGSAVGGGVAGVGGGVNNNDAALNNDGMNNDGIQQQQQDQQQLQQRQNNHQVGVNDDRNVVQQHLDDQDMMDNNNNHDGDEEEEEEEEVEEDNAEEDGEEDEEEDDDAVEEEEVDEEDDDIDDEEEEDNGDDEEEATLYKNWSWSNQFGNPDILRPHPTQSSSMVVGQDGTYLLLLRFAAALPSPLARIKWEEEEEDRRVTRSERARRRRNRNRGGGGGGRFEEDILNGNHHHDNGGFDGMGNNDNDDDDNDSNHSKDLEEDYFVTVNIEAPLQTVMDAVDESQTHFPILRAGLWDYRTEDEVLNEDPVYATVSAMDVVSLCAGDILSVSFMNDEVSREKSPLPDDSPPELVNSLTLIKVCGNTLARYERCNRVSSGVGQDNIMHYHHHHHLSQGGGSRHGRSGLTPFSTPERKHNAYRRRPSSQHSDDHQLFEEDSSHDDDSHYNQQEEFDRSLTQTAHWTKPRNDFQSTPFQPPLHSDASTLEFPHPGQYLLLGRVAVGCRRNATFQPVLSGGPLEGHRAQLSVRSAGGRLLHAVGAFVFEDKPRLSGSDLSILSENGMFNDVVYIPRSGTELSIKTTGDCRLHPEGTQVGPFCSAVSQCLSLLLIDDDIMEVDRYMLRTVKSSGANPQREIKWFHTRSATSPRGRGKGGTSLEPSLFDVDGHRLVWRGSCSYTNTDPISTVLIMGSIPPLHRGYVLALLKNNQPLAISITPESLDMKGRHCHYFQEIVELRDGDEITIADCAFGERWRDLISENRRVEFDSRMGHLSFVMLQRYSDEEVVGNGSNMMMM